jgi:flagellar basal-body rod protein FlgF
MTSGYYAACTGLVARTAALETIANNLANVSTAGFRGTHNVFSSLLASSGENSFSTLNQDTNDFGVLSATRIDSTQGALQKTGNELDVAIEGPGYFAAQTPSGPIYTRGGSFHILAQGQLVTSNGDPVLGENGPITIVGSPLSISADGTISVRGALAGRLKITEFPASTQLESAGGTYYKAPPGTATSATKSAVRQGVLESSNVNPVTSVVEMISAQRDVETMRRVLTMFNAEMDKTAAQDLPHVS